MRQTFVAHDASLKLLGIEVQQAHLILLLLRDGREGLRVVPLANRAWQR